jgi:serine phosphatase RsbU (regulator of sigma subunit)
VLLSLASELLGWLLKTVQEFSGSEQEDDITLVIARCQF